MELIDKPVIVAEIEKRIKTNKGCMLGLRNLDYYQGKIDALNDTISFLSTLEVKVEDLDKEIDEVIYKLNNNRYTPISSADIEWIAKHFFELGLKAKKGGGE